MRRAAVGIIALGFLAVAGYGFARYGLRGGESTFLWSCCFRMGLVLACFWFALPKLMELDYRVSPPVLILSAAFVLLIVVRPKAILFLWPVIVPVLVILAAGQFFRWLVKPPPKKSKKRVANGKKKKASGQRQSGRERRDSA